MNHNKLKILIVDDDDEILEMYRELFETDGFEVYSACSPSIALETYKQIQNISLIISDSKMGEFSGIEFLKSLTAAYLTIPVFYLVTGNLDQDEKYFKSIGGHRLILKPFDLDEIMVKIKTDLKIL